MTTIRIHRGTHAIGGTITEVRCGDTAIFIDFGTELSTSGTSTDGKMVELIESRPDVSGVFFTHYHGDHTGLFARIPEGIPLYMGATARQVLENIREALLAPRAARDTPPERAAVLRREAAILRGPRLRELVHGRRVEVSPRLWVTPLLTDHSAFDAFMLLIETFHADGSRDKTILHTGDFRDHGWRGQERMARLLSRLDGLAVDVLLIEGTMLDRGREWPQAEFQLAHGARELLRQEGNRPAFVLCSSTNADSLASFQFAARENGRVFLVSDYLKSQLALYQRAASRGRRPGVYDFSRAEAFGFENGRLRGTVTGPDELAERGFLMVIGQREGYRKLMERYGGGDPLLIYSLWTGYIDGRHPGCTDENLVALTGAFRTRCLHTSGHAYVDTLEKLVQDISPREAVIPLHTEDPDRFRRMKLGPCRDKVEVLQDGELWPRRTVCPEP